jgi:hypothetical protein
MRTDSRPKGVDAAIGTTAAVLDKRKKNLRSAR